MGELYGATPLLAQIHTDPKQGIGVFQDYYQAHQLASYSPSDVAWITATEGFMLFFFVRPHYPACIQRT